ncbi:MAG: ribosome recycling factor [Candidatus Sungiibacteriota bacterium]
MNDLKQKMDSIFAHLREEMASLRTGRATSALVEHIEVDYYGVKTPLKALAAIAVPDARQIVIQPWDKNAVQPIERAIQASALGLAPITDHDAIRLTIPQLTEDRRRDLGKLLGKMIEDARIRMRRDRDNALKEIENKCKAKEIGEDERDRQKKGAQKIIDEANKKIEDMTAAKEKEIMTV